MMLLKQTTLLASLALSGALAALNPNTTSPSSPFTTGSSTSPSSSSDPVMVYRADMRSPPLLKVIGCLLTDGLADNATTKNGYVYPIDETNLYMHANKLGGDGLSYGYIFTTPKYSIVKDFLNKEMNGTGYIYKIHVSENLIDVRKTLGSYYAVPGQQEYAAFGSVHYNQIHGWTKFEKKGNGTTLVSRYVNNPDYDAKMYEGKTASVQYQLAGFPDGFPAWSEGPWKKVTNCSNSKDGEIKERRLGMSECKPLKTALEYAVDYYYKLTA